MLRVMFHPLRMTWPHPLEFQTAEGGPQKVGLVREMMEMGPLISNLGWWNIMIWPDNMGNHFDFFGIPNVVQSLEELCVVL